MCYCWRALAERTRCALQDTQLHCLCACLGAFKVPPWAPSKPVECWGFERRLLRESQSTADSQRFLPGESWSVSLLPCWDRKWRAEQRESLALTMKTPRCPPTLPPQALFRLPPVSPIQTHTCTRSIGPLNDISAHILRLRRFVWQRVKKK